ncbi:hypothetical protein IWZ00DRAFT_102968 [Phyllosticta capitalensis]
MKGKLFVVIPPLPSAASGSLGPPPPQPEPKRFGVDVSPGDTFGDIWPRIEDKFSKFYPQEFSFFKIKKLQAYGCDLGVDELVDDWFEEESDRSKKILHVVRAPIDRNTSVAPNSALQPSNLRKRTLLPAIEESIKRRRVEEEQYGVSIEDMQPDRPIRSREHDTEGLPPGRRATSLGDSDVVVAGSQREAVPYGTYRDILYTKIESPDPTPLMDVPEAPSGRIIGTENGFHAQSANEGAFKLPGLPASAAKDTPARGVSTRRSATPRRRKNSVQIHAFPPRPPWHRSPSPSGQLQDHGPSQSVPDSPLTYPINSQLSVSEIDSQPPSTYVARTPTPTQPDDNVRKPPSIPPAGPTSSLREPSPILGTPTSAQRPPQSPLGAQSTPIETNPDGQASQSLQHRRKHNDEASDDHEEQSSPRTLVTSSANGIKSGKAGKSDTSRQRRSSTADTAKADSERRARDRLQELTGGQKFYGQGRGSSWSAKEDEILVVAKEAGIIFPDICKFYLPNRTYRGVSHRYIRLMEEAGKISRTSEPSQSSSKLASSPQVPESAGKDLQSSHRRASSPEVRIPYKNMRYVGKESSSVHAATPSKLPTSSHSAPEEPSSSRAVTSSKLPKSSHSAPKESSSSQASTSRKKAKPSQSAPEESSSTHAATSNKQSKSTRPAAQEPPSSQVTTSGKQSKSSRSAPKEQSSSQARPSRKKASPEASSSQKVNEELEALNEKYVKKQAEKAAAEKKKEACLNRQIKAKKFRELAADGRARDQRRAEREKQKEKEVARLRHREQEQLREFRANLYACEQNGLTWSQSSVLLKSDQPSSQPDAGKSTEVRGKQKKIGSQRQIYNIPPDSAPRPSQNKLKSRRRTDSAPGSMDGVDEQQEAAEYARQRESAKREKRHRGTAPSSQLQDAGKHGEEAVAPPAEQDAGEPMDLDKVSSVHNGLSAQEATEAMELDKVSSVRNGPSAQEAAEAMDVEEASQMESGVPQQTIDAPVELAKPPSTEQKVFHHETSKPAKQSSKRQKMKHHSASLTTYNPKDNSDSFSDSDSITSPEPEPKSHSRVFGTSSARQKTPSATNPPATNPPATNPPATIPPATIPPATIPPTTNSPTSEPEEPVEELHPANYVPSSPSDVASSPSQEAEERPASSPPAAQNGVHEIRPLSHASSSSSGSEDSSDSEASNSEASDDEASDDEASPAPTRTQALPQPAASAPEEQKLDPNRYILGDPRLMTMTELKRTMKDVPVPKPVVEAPPKQPEPESDSSSDESSSSSSSSSDGGDPNDPEKIERRERRKEKNRRKTQKGIRSLMKLASNVPRLW